MRERDAEVLSITLRRGLEDGALLETLKSRVEGWRANAQGALTAEDFRACVDKFREVTVDARVYFLRRAQIDDEEGDEDDHPRL